MREGLCLRCGPLFHAAAQRDRKSAIHRGNFTENLLYTTENQVIAALTSDTLGKADWERFRRLGAIVKTEDPSGEYPVRKISAKKRYIDPFVEGKGRVTQLSPAFKSAAGEFLAEDFQHGIKGLSGDNL